MKKFEIEITRHDVTPSEFLSYVRRRVDAKGGRMFRADLDLRYFKRGNDLNFDIRYDSDGPCKAEKSVSKPFQMQTYIRNWDGTVYNEICEFDFWDDKTGTGYYYLINTWNSDEIEAGI